MSAGRWPEIEALLDAALDLPPAARAALLDDPTTGDPEVRAEVRRLLGLSVPAEWFLDEAAAEFAAPMVAGFETIHDGTDGDDPARERIGPYRILREIGRGGMGAVYLAERDDEQFHMQVALKVVPRGMDSEHALRRFREERQILATLEHPYIARLLDGGVTADGLPWFAMEHVDGRPIDEHCDAQGLTVEARLELFCNVCDAVQFAHRNLVVHRDLKPSNILVVTADAGRGADGVPKLLDFGIAKLLEPEATRTAADPLTGTGMRVMTPEYASPEQVRGEPITTASDVYSLGVLLYELLTGHRPYRWKPQSAGEAVRAVCEVEPPPPSSVAGHAEEWIRGDGTAGRITPEEISRQRGTSAERLCRRLRGDLDTIVLKALRKEPERRYASVQALADDLERHLAGKPVEARPDTARYRAGKFVRRHRAGVAAAAMLALSLVGGLAGTTWQARAATREAQRAEVVKTFLISLFKAELPDVSRGRELSARELLDQGATRIDSELAGEPAVQAELLSVLAATYLELGLTDAAEPLANRSLVLRRGIYGERHPLVASSLNQVARVRFDRGDYDAAERIYREVLELRRRVHRRTHPDLARSLQDVASVLSRKGDYEAAEPLFREALAIDRLRYGDDHLVVADDLNELGVLLWRRASYAQAEATHQEALAVRRKHLDEDHPDVLTSLFNLATVRDDLGDPRAEPLFREVLERRRRIYRGAHPILAVTLENLSGTLSRRGELREAEPFALEALEMKRQMLGDDHVEVAAARNNLAVMKYRAGDLEAAQALMREALRVWRATHGSAHPNVAAALNNLGGILNQQGSYRSATPLLEEAVALRRELLGKRHPEVAQTLRNLAIAQHQTGSFSAAESNFSEALSIYRAGLPEGHPRTGEVLVAFGSFLTDRSKSAEAEPMLREAARIRRAALDAGDWRIAEAEAALGQALAALGNHAEAEPLLLASYESLRISEGVPQAESRHRAIEQLAALYAATGNVAEAARFRALRQPR